MRTQLFIALSGAIAIAAPTLSPCAVAQPEDSSTKKTWAGVATLRTLRSKSKNGDLLAAYPVFGGSRRVAQVAGLALKKDATGSFNEYKKKSRTPTGIGVPYQLEVSPALVINRPRFISTWVYTYTFDGGVHGYTNTVGYNFGIPNGATGPRRLLLADFFTDGKDASKRVNDLLMAKLRATKGKEQEAMWVLDGTVKWVDVKLRENFVAEADGMRWVFPPYAVGPYANGNYEVKLSASELGPKFRAALLR